MPPGLYNSRFIQAGRTPAWHLEGWLLGDVQVNAMTACMMNRPYAVYKVPCKGVDPIDGQIIDTEYCLIIREATPDDKQKRVFGRPVTKDYELIDLYTASHAWDLAVGNIGDEIETPIETYGILGRGEELFITAQSYMFSVKGDEMATYEFLYSPMHSDKAAVCGITPVRICCANTLATGLASALVKFFIDHLPGATQKLQNTISEMHRQNKTNVEQMKAAFEYLSDKRVKDDAEAKLLISNVLTDPVKPEPEWNMQYGITFDEHMLRYEEKVKEVERFREVIFGLYSGDGTAMDMDSVKGNRFGVYNAFSEFWTYARGPHQKTAVSLLAGDRAGEIRKAFNVLSKD